jgi:hypothetical protein
MQQDCDQHFLVEIWAINRPRTTKPSEPVDARGTDISDCNTPLLPRMLIWTSVGDNTWNECWYQTNLVLNLATTQLCGL